MTQASDAFKAAVEAVIVQAMTGTGDSLGNAKDALIAQYKADIEAAVAEALKPGADSEAIITALTKEFVHIQEGSSGHTVRWSHKSVDDAVLHVQQLAASLAAKDVRIENLSVRLGKYRKFYHEEVHPEITARNARIKELEAQVERLLEREPI